MIRRVSFKDLDTEKYRACISRAAQGSFQANLDFLLCLNGRNWDFIVYKDYEAVMPVYYKRKMGIRFVISPPYTNQMGIFSEKDDFQLNRLFLDYLLSQYNVVYYPFNAGNHFGSLQKRKNFRLESGRYDKVRSNYSVHRRRNSRLKDDGTEFRPIEKFSCIASFFMRNALGLPTQQMKRHYKNALLRIEQQFRLKIYGLFRNSVLVCAAILSDFEDELALLHLISDKALSTSNDASVLIDQILRLNIEQKSFNFFGSNIATVAEFYRRFGAQEETYCYVRQTKARVLKNLRFK